MVYIPIELQKTSSTLHTSPKRRIYRSTRSAHTTRTIAALFDGLTKRVFSKPELVHLIETSREEWDLVQSAPPEEVIDDIMESLPLRQFTLRSDNYENEFPRYAWGTPNPLEVAASIRAPKSYLCHSSALFMHKLLDRIPQELCVNYEQSAKPKPAVGLTQSSLDRAFQGKQRQSAFIFNHEARQIIVLSGKHTDGLAVQELPLDSGVKVRVTSLERTLIDVTVRPGYAGGIEGVLNAYRRALDAISVSKLVNILKQLDYVYPYHQAVGFYMERAGFQDKQLSAFKALGLNWDFYLAHGRRNTAFNSTWRIHHPKGL